MKILGSSDAKYAHEKGELLMLYTVHFKNIIPRLSYQKRMAVILELAGLNYTEIASRFNVHPDTVLRWLWSAGKILS